MFVPLQAEAQWTWTPETGRLVNLKNLPKETPELQLEYTRSLLLDGQEDRAWNETDKFIRFYEDSEEADENQFLKGEIRQAEQRYLDAAEQFQQVRANYPGSELHSEVIRKQYEIADSLFEKGRAREAILRGENAEDVSFFDRIWWRINPLRRKPLKHAISVYEMVIKNEPFTDQAAEAQYKIGLCHFTREEYDEAVIEYRRLRDEYPGSGYVKDATYGLIETYDAQTLGPEYDQTPTLLTIETIDDFVKEYPADPRVSELGPLREEKMQRIADRRRRTARYYQRRANHLAARIYDRVIVDEFAGTEAAARSLEQLNAEPAPQGLRNRFLNLDIHGPLERSAD